MVSILINDGITLYQIWYNFFIKYGITLYNIWYKLWYNFISNMV